MKSKISIDKLGQWNDNILKKQEEASEKADGNGLHGKHAGRQKDMELQDIDLSEDLMVDNPIRTSIARKFKRGEKVTAEDLETLVEFVDETMPSFHHFIVSRYRNIRREDYWLCVLVRCHFPPKEIAAMLGISGQHVAMKRRRLQERIFGLSGGSKDFDRKVRNIKG